MIEALDALERHAGVDRAAFEADELLQAFFLRHLQILGEAARGLPEDVRALARDVPWSKMIGMRNILVHGYFHIDTEIVWVAATRDAPAVKGAIRRLLNLLDAGAGRPD